ncbi:hypothetical protein [Thermoactinomyces mirandus]|uniref:Uncharacterized protein n=1 Tax=Thermoactinomyces mirandus TaxID=2756294 RepID=A0A7W1XQT6_9BACL|nr:hypothetical protein [Thermoactinomyces mirandus]MBA4601558.1 hypothetical protein [Thermoactinomyces mirandus]
MKHSLQDNREVTGQFHHQLPHVVDTCNAFTGDCFRGGALSKKEKNLITLALGLLQMMSIALFIIPKNRLTPREYRSQPV